MTEIAWNWWQLFAGTLFVAGVWWPVELLAGAEKHSLASRLRGVAFWAIFLLTIAIAYWVLQNFARACEIKPLLTLDFSNLGENWNAVARLVVVFLLTFVPAFINDFIYYWFHRMQHAVPLLWRFHAVHHSIEEMNVANCHHHWTEGILRPLFISLPLILIIDLRLPEIAALSFAIGTWAQFVHADLRFDFGLVKYLFVSPVFHRVHHSTKDKHFDKNFAGIFPLFDLLFSTACFPDREESIPTGLNDRCEPRTAWEYMFALRSRPKAEPTTTANHIAMEGPSKDVGALAIGKAS